MPKPIDLSGQTFTRLTVTNTWKKSSKGRLWLCQCTCGNTVWARTDSLKIGDLKSCGCLLREMRSGHTRLKAYGSWRSIKERCENPNCRSYKDYGARGITCCDEWRSFSNFYNDMGERPEGYTLERLDNSKGYCKENCKWIPKSSQSLNQRSNLNITYQGKTQCLAEWVRELNLDYKLVYNRIHQGMPFETAITRPKGRWINESN